MYWILLISGIIGIYRGLIEIKYTKLGILLGVKPSNNLIEFIFLNK